MPPLSAEQQRRIANILKRYPGRKEGILAAVEAKGYEVDRGEFEPVDVGAEMDEFARGAAQAATLGFLNVPSRTDVGDVDLFGMEFSPSRALGQAAGILLPGGLALKGARRLTAPLAGRAALRAGAEEALVGGAVAAGEEAVDVIQGEEFDPNYVLGVAASGAALGIVGSRLMQRLRSAAAKRAAGESLDETEREALGELQRLLPEITEGTRRQRATRGALPAATEGGPSISVGEAPGRAARRAATRTGIAPPTEGGGAIELPGYPLRSPDEARQMATRRGLAAADVPGGPTPMGPRVPQLEQFVASTRAQQGLAERQLQNIRRRADRLLNDVQRGQLDATDAIQQWDGYIARNVRLPQQAPLVHSMRQALRRAELGDQVPDPPDVPDVVVRFEKPAPEPMRPPPEPEAPAPPGRRADLTTAERLTPNQVMLRHGGLRDGDVQRILDQAGVADRTQRATIAKLKAGTAGKTIEEMFEEVAADPGSQAVFLQAGIETPDDLYNAARTGKLWTRYSTEMASEADYLDELAAHQRGQLDFSTHPKDLEDGILQAVDMDDLQNAFERVQVAHSVRGIDDAEYEALEQVMHQVADDLQGAPAGGAIAGRSVGSGRAPSALSEETLDLPGMPRRQLPETPIAQGAADRGLEGTPFDDAIEEIREQMARAEAPQETIRFDPDPASQPPTRTLSQQAATEDARLAQRGSDIRANPPAVESVDALMQGYKVGDDVVLMMRTGSPKVGQYMGPDEAIPGAIRIQHGPRGREVSYQADQIAEVRRFKQVRGGGPDPDDTSGPSTDGQRKKLYALESDLERMGLDERIGTAPQQMTRREASRRIREMETLRSQADADQLNAQLEDIQAVAGGTVPNKSFRELAEEQIQGSALSGPSLEDVQNLPDDYFQDVGMRYMAGMAPEISETGMRANPLTERILYADFDRVHNTERDTERYLRALDEILTPLSREDQYRVGRILDEGPQLLDRWSHLREPYQGLRGMLDEAAQQLGLEPGQQIRHYYPHVFRGTLGRWRSVALGDILGGRVIRNIMRSGGPAERIRGLRSGRIDIEAQFPLQRFFTHVIPRQGIAGFEMDTRKALYAYFTGAARKAHDDQFLRQAHELMKQLPSHTRGGRKLNIRKVAAEHIAYSLGQPTSQRLAIANTFAKARRFNRSVDALVEWVGGAPERGLLRKARRLGELNEKMASGQTLTAAEQAERQAMAAGATDALQWLDRMLTESQKYVDGLPTRTPRMRRYRSELALKLDDMRAALADPNRQAVVLQSAYRYMVLSKLGLNLAHGLVNLTQSITNTWPLLDTRYVARGMRNYALSDWQKRILGGRRIGDILDESGILLEVPKAAEFQRKRLGRMAWFEDYIMLPSRKSEAFLRGTAVLGAYEQRLAQQGVKAGQMATKAQHADALQFARRITERSQFPFNRAGTPRPLRHPAMRMLFAFQSYPIHQFDFSAELIRKAITDGDWGPLVKHATAYAALAGAGAAVAGNVWKRTQHPVFDIFDLGEYHYNRDVMDLMTGPAWGALSDALAGNVTQALGELEPTAIRRARIAADRGRPLTAPERYFGTLFEDADQEPVRRRGIPAIGTIGRIE